MHDWRLRRGLLHFSPQYIDKHIIINELVINYFFVNYLFIFLLIRTSEGRVCGG